MTYIVIMKRTQLFLDETAAQMLAAESRRRGTTVSALVREVISAAYGSPDPSGRQDLIRELSGIWAGRTDLAAVDAHVRALRRSNRSKRWAKRGAISS